MAAGRNKSPILSVITSEIDKLQRSALTPFRILEIASGSGEHAAHFAANIPNVIYQPTEMDDSMHPTIVSSTTSIPGVLPPVTVDIRNFEHPFAELPASVRPGAVDLMICINMIHISPFDCTHALFRAASQLLSATGFLYLYGPYRVNGTMVESNEAFDKSLKSRNAEWGIRDLEDVISIGEEHGLVFDKTVEMPANNLSVIFRKSKECVATK